MEPVCRELGLTTTAAFTIFVTKVAREKRISFAVAVDPFYRDENMVSACHSQINCLQSMMVSINTLFSNTEKTALNLVAKTLWKQQTVVD